MGEPPALEIDLAVATPTGRGCCHRVLSLGSRGMAVKRSRDLGSSFWEALVWAVMAQEQRDNSAQLLVRGAGAGRQSPVPSPGVRRWREGCGGCSAPGRRGRVTGAGPGRSPGRRAGPGGRRCRAGPPLSGATAIRVRHGFSGTESCP